MGILLSISHVTHTLGTHTSDIATERDAFQAIIETWFIHHTSLSLSNTHTHTHTHTNPSIHPPTRSHALPHLFLSPTKWMPWFKNELCLIIWPFVNLAYILLRLPSHVHIKQNTHKNQKPPYTFENKPFNSHRLPEAVVLPAVVNNNSESPCWDDAECQERLFGCHLQVYTILYTYNIIYVYIWINVYYIYIFDFFWCMHV